jgi:hypothetical protein
LRLVDRDEVERRPHDGSGDAPRARLSHTNQPCSNPCACPSSSPPSSRPGLTTRSKSFLCGRCMSGRMSSHYSRRSGPVFCRHPFFGRWPPACRRGASAHHQTLPQHMLNTTHPPQPSALPFLDFCHSSNFTFGNTLGPAPQPDTNRIWNHPSRGQPGPR